MLTRTVKKRKLPRRRRQRIHGALSRLHSNDAGDSSTAEVSPQSNAAPVYFSSLNAISAPGEASPAEKKTEEPTLPTSANENRATPPPSLELAELPEARVTQLIRIDVRLSGPASAPDDLIQQRDFDLKGFRQEMDEELEKKLSAQNAGLEATLKAVIQTTVTELTEKFDRKLDLQTKSLEDKIRKIDAKISLQEVEIKVMKVKLMLLEEVKSSANQSSSAAEDENQDSINNEAADTEDDGFFDAEEGMPEPAPLSNNVATTNQVEQPEIIPHPRSIPAIWQRVQLKLR